MIPEAGMLVTPNLRLVRPLGSGGMGSVWVAQHLALDTEVAVKLIGERDERAVERFRREASLAARLKSPHVVQVFDHGVAREIPYIVMELLSGESLAERLARAGRLAPREVVLLVSQVAKVLTEAHALGIVHRDLKPSNLFLVDSGYELFVKVLDFGIAKRRDELSTLTDSRTLVGTPQYMSPEALMSSRDADHRADLWALAVIAYQALTGQAPFAGETFSALTIAVHEARFAPPSALEPTLTPEIDAWFKIALCRRSEQRPASAGELAHSFREACAASHEEALGDARKSADPGTVTLDSGERLDRAIVRERPAPARRWPLPVGIVALVAAGAVWALSARRAPVPAAAVWNVTVPVIDAPPVATPAPRSVQAEPPAPPSPAKTAPRPPAASASAAPLQCKEPFTVDEHGDLVPRPECFRR